MALAMRAALALLALPDLSRMGALGLGRFVDSAAARETLTAKGQQLRVAGEDSWRRRAGQEPQSCTVLRNRGTHFTVEIEVGTPPQNFDVVADTGSDSVIVESCVCADTHRCSAENKCFRGTNRSASFSVRFPAFAPRSAVVLTFGSGQIEAVVASDVVRVGGVQAALPDGLLLMVDRALDISGPFEGILGLGVPHHEGLGFGGYSSKSFLETAGVPRFSMCFNAGADGVLRLGTPVVPGAMGSIGQLHWALDLQGISVGHANVPVQVCSPASMRSGQLTACGAIPDSGTTLMMAPARHLQLLFSELCDQWERCRNASTSSHYRKHELFQAILLDCADWLSDDVGLHELPPLHFHVAGAGGAQQTIKLDGPAYILATKQEEMRYVTERLFGVFPVKVAIATGRKRDVCLPAFGSHDYTTQKNGPIWILGTPLFFEFQVGYDMQSTPPGISLINAPCGACNESASLVSSDRHVSSVRSHAIGRPRYVHGPMRIPKIDTSLPL